MGYFLDHAHNSIQVRLSRLRFSLAYVGAARTDMRAYRTLPLASEAKMPPKQSAAKMMKHVFILC